MDRQVVTTARIRQEPARRLTGPVFLIGVLLLALNLRPAVTAVPSILDEIGRQLHYSSVMLTVVTTAPVVCFAVFSPPAGWLGRRIGDERGLGLAIAAVAVGQVVRALWPDPGFLPATVLTSAGIAVMNVLLSSLVKRRAPDRAAHLLGAYLAMLYLGAMLGSAVSVPLYHAGHRSIGLPLGVWAIPAAVAVVAWVPQLDRRAGPGPAARGPAARGCGAGGGDESSRQPLRLHRSSLAWCVTAFMGLQSLTYYGSLSILPDLYRSRGMDASTAGLVNTMLSIGGVITAVVAPVLVARFDVGRVTLIASAVAGAVGIAGTLLVPLAAALPLAFILGLSQGVSIALALYFIMARAETPAVAGALSGMAQGIGYTIAVAGPLGAGLLHSATGSWDASIALLAVLTVLTLWFGLLAARDRIITDGAAPVVAPTGTGRAGL